MLQLRIGFRFSPSKGDDGDENLCPLRPSLHRAGGRCPRRRDPGLRRAGHARLCRPRERRAAAGAHDHMLDYSAWFVMPGLVDVHTHLAYGNAKSEEDIDLYSPLEFRTLRGMFFAQKVAAAGFTAICSPGDAGQISLS